MSEDALLELILDKAGAGQRIMIGIAGPPGAGKSTLAEALCARLNERLSDDPALVVPMDGFHFDNDILVAQGLLPRKGAPQTFDVAGFHHLLTRLRGPEPEIGIPVFDRDRDLARAGARLITPVQRILLIEGNYLLLKMEPWSRLKSLFDLTVFLPVPMSLLEERLVQRWLDHGLTLSAAETRARGNDIPNAALVLAESQPADCILRY
ncbi:MAG: nucleoside triphosphate hydrolase [Rhodospirillaceae bacterium]|nr:nucleoside triphosphate hydrolase [Rhodospirillaceae bacterium]